MGQAFKAPIDIMNRALQHCRMPRIYSTTEMSGAAQECVFAYDKIRRRELRRNVWRFATRRVALRPLASTTVLLQPVLYNSTSTYHGGQIVVDANGDFWISLINGNTGIAPGLPGSGWDAYFGPLTVTPWDQPTPPDPDANNPYNPGPGIQYGSTQGHNGYYAGELTYIPDGKGGAQIFQATLTSINQPQNDGPFVIDVWQPAVTYSKGDIAFLYSDPNGQLILGVPPGLGTVGGLSTTAFESTINLNTGNQPDLCEPNAPSSQPWSPIHTYAAGDIAVAADGQLYQSVQSGNLNHTPLIDGTYVWWTPLGMFAGTWTTAITPQPRAASNQWQYIPGTFTSMVIPYPLTAGPVDDQRTRNAYRLPAGYLREAPPDPKRGGIGFLGATTNTVSWDVEWVYEGDFIVSDNIEPILYRFVADVTDVTRMDDMFCEGLAAELAMAVAPILQPDRNDIIATAKQAYEEAIEEARLVNGIETGDVQPPQDEYITCRI